MDKRNVGRSGLRVTTVGLGCNNFGWKIDEAASQKVVDKAIDQGINLFDTADYYGVRPGDSEVVLGKCLGGHRKDIVLVTKFGVDPAGDGLQTNTSRSFVLEAAEKSLARLGTDWIDVYMLHWPDHATPIEETLRALETLVQSGKVRYIAWSNLDPWRVSDAVWTSRSNGLTGFIAGESHYSLLTRGAEKDVIPMLDHFGMGLFPYFPLESGLLTGKYKRDGGGEGRLKDNFLGLGDVFLNDQKFDVIDKLAAFAEEKGHTLLELAVSWLASQPAVSSVICGATKPEQVEQNVAASGWKLTSEDLAAIDALTGA